MAYVEETKALCINLSAVVGVGVETTHEHRVPGSAPRTGFEVAAGGNSVGHNKRNADQRGIWSEGQELLPKVREGQPTSGARICPV